MSEVATKGRAVQIYEFDGFHFHPDQRLLIRVRDGHRFTLMPKSNALLLVLLKRRGEVVAYDDMRKEVWRDTPQVLTHTIRETKHSLVKALGESAGKLETVAGKGYRFNVEVVVRQSEGAAETSFDLTAAGGAGAAETEKTRVLKSQESWPEAAGARRGPITFQLGPI